MQMFVTALVANLCIFYAFFYGVEKIEDIFGYEWYTAPTLILWLLFCLWLLITSTIIGFFS